MSQFGACDKCGTQCGCYDAPCTPEDIPGGDIVALETVTKCLSSVSIVSHNSVCPCPKESEAYAAFVTAVGRGRTLTVLGLTRVLHVLAAVLLDLLHTMKSV